MDFIFALPLHSIICIFGPMKYVAFILSFYFLALNVMPCTDNDTSVDDLQTHISYQQGSNHNQGGLDYCSPFCSCHCCHVHTIKFDPIVFKIIKPVIFQETFDLFNDPTKDIHTSILQPPQV